MNKFVTYVWDNANSALSSYLVWEWGHRSGGVVSLRL
jgi:hypothetical protein